MRAWKVLVIAALMTAGLITLAVVLRGVSARFVTQYWLDQLDTVPDDRAPALLEQIVALDEVGVPILVAALGSPREAVSRAAADVLTEQLHRWQNQPSQANLRKQTALAVALSEQVSAFGPIARHEAGQLAARVLLVLPQEQAVDRNRLIAACEKVLQIAAAGQREQPLLDKPATVAAAVRPRDRVERRHDLLPPEDSIPTLAQLPGGGLPVAGLEGDGARVSPEGTGFAARGDARPLPVPVPPRVLHPLADSRPLETRQGPMKRLVLGDKSATEAADVLPPTVVRAAPHGTAGVQRASDLIGADTVELMRQLQATDESAVAAARAELIRRKFTPAHLEAARRLFHADPEVRKGLARTLPETPGLDAVPWLLCLSRDPEADVRLLAVTLLATTADPAVLEQVETIARNDSDPRVQQLGERLGRPRSAP
jgi:hypothetical protein